MNPAPTADDLDRIEDLSDKLAGMGRKYIDDSDAEAIVRGMRSAVTEVRRLRDICNLRPGWQAVAVPDAVADRLIGHVASLANVDRANAEALISSPVARKAEQT